MSIKIIDYLDENSIVLGLKQKNKKNTLSYLLDHLIQKKKVNKEYKKEILKTLLRREEMGSTAIGGGIALPHARLNSISSIIICIGVSPQGIEFDSLDQEPVNIVTLLLSSQKEAGLHLKMLAFLARMLRDKYFVQQVKKAKKAQEVLLLVNKQQRVIS